MTNVQWVCVLRNVPSTVIMDWLTQSSFTISAFKVEANKHWIGIKIAEVSMCNGVRMRGIDAHITLVRLQDDDEAKQLVDLRDGKDRASWLLSQAMLQYENELSLCSYSSDIEAAYQWRNLENNCSFLHAIWWMKCRILAELDIHDAVLPRYPHLSISGNRNMDIAISAHQYLGLGIDRYCVCFYAMPRVGRGN